VKTYLRWWGIESSNCSLQGRCRAVDVQEAAGAGVQALAGLERGGGVDARRAGGGFLRRTEAGVAAAMARGESWEPL
jgi:hypothetical protein